MIAIGETEVQTISGLPCLVTRQQDLTEVTREGTTVRPMFRAEVIGAVPELVTVEIGPEPGRPGCFYVHPVWARVDRPDTGGYGVRGRAIADRLAKAIRAGKAITGEAVLVDVNGRTYVDARHHVLGRTLNADLRRLGF